MRTFVKTFILSFIVMFVVTGIGLLASGQASAASGGSVNVWTQKGLRGSVARIEAMSDNIGWCIPVGKSLPGGVGRSIKNGSSTYVVKAYAGERCDRGGFNVKPGTQRTGVMGGAVYIRSIKIVRK